MTCIGELTCIPSHGNAEDSGLCARCEDAAIEARDKRIDDVRAALTTFAGQVSLAHHYDVPRILENVLDACVVQVGDHSNPSERCLLCGWTDGCKPGCATEALAGLVDG